MKGITAKNLVRGIRFFKANPNATCKSPDWTRPTWDRRDFMNWFHECLSEKINRSDVRKKWRKMSSDYQRGLLQDSREINYPRLIIRYIRTPELRARFSNRLRTNCS